MSNNKNLFILNSPTLLRINPALAEEIGLNESIMLLQLDFWIKGVEHEYDGRMWTYQSVRNMQEKAFSFWSIATINRTINSLLQKNLIIEGNYNKKRYDKTRWIALNYEELQKLKSIKVDGYDTPLNQNDTHSNQIDTSLYQNDTHSNQNDTPIPKNPTKSMSKNPTKDILSSKELDLIAPIKYLNQKTGRNFSYTCGSTLRLVRARYKEGRTLDDFIRVIDKKYNDWHNDPKMKTYLRPSTLFNQTKFENYINEIDVTTKTNINTDAITQWINKKGGETNE